MAEHGHQCCCPDFTRKLMPPLWGQNRNEPWPRWAAWTFLEWHGGQLSSGGQWLHCSVMYCIYNENTEKQRTDSKCFYFKSISLQLSHAHTDIEQVNDVILAVKRSLQCKKKQKQNPTSPLSQYGEEGWLQQPLSFSVWACENFQKKTWTYHIIACCLFPRHYNTVLFVITFIQFII